MNSDNLILKTLAECITHERNQRILTRNELAERSGISLTSIRRIESCEMNPSFNVLSSLVHTLDFSFDSAFYTLYYKNGYRPQPWMVKIAPYDPYDLYLAQDLTSLGAALKAARTRRNMTRPHLAAVSGVNIRAIRKIEGEGLNPSFTTLYTIVQALDISFSYLFSYERPGKKYFKSIESIIVQGAGF